MRKAIEDNIFLFEDDIFQIQPQQGQIYPNSEMTITICFVPKNALHYNCLSYCNISCSEERLNLTLSGNGIGPKAVLSQNELAIGNKFVNERASFEVQIENRGEIECRFELIPNERSFGKMFTFERTRGVMNVGQRMILPISFCSSIPGEFKEAFRFKLEGSSEILQILGFGHVIAPTFKFDTELIDFKKVSYSFPVYQTISLTNSSDVAFTYCLRIPGDGKLIEKEFEIVPARAEI